MPRPPRRPRSRSSLVLRWIALGVLALIAVSYVPPLRAYLKTREEVAVRAAEVRVLEARRQALERRLRAQTSDTALLRAARELGYVRPGERLFIVKGIDAWRRAQAPAGSRRDPG